MKKVLSILLTVVIAVGVLIGCGSTTKNMNDSAVAKARTLDEIKKDGKIKIGIFSDKKPFGYVDSDGTVQG